MNMSSVDYEITERGIVWPIRDGIIPSNIVSDCEEAMRYTMDVFIETGVDLTTFTNPALICGNLRSCKRVMHTQARCMDLKELLMGTQMYVIMCGGQSMQIYHLGMFSNCENIDELTSQTKKLLKKINQQYDPASESCEILEHLNISNTNTASAILGECSFMGQFQNHDASYILFLSLLHETYTAISRLIEATTRYYATFHRTYLEQRRTDSWIYLGSSPIDWSRPVDWAAEHACSRDKFLKRVGLQPPQVLRMIDVETTCRQGERVVLIDYLADGNVQKVGYATISHTFGMPVYEAFDCPCATQCSAKLRPRCSNEACRHVPHQYDVEGAASSCEQQKRVVNDILRMCDILRKAGVKYAWHDGVCIAQHDDAEVEETIKHMGWIYANAKETVIFLHYVGAPMAPIRNSNSKEELCCRWHTRVWTLQEAALSKCRRYCVRAGPLGDCQSVEELEEKIAFWYRDDSSTIEIMEEERFFEFLKEIYTVSRSLRQKLAEKVLSMEDDGDDDAIAESNWMWSKVCLWYECTMHFIETLLWTCFKFPTMETALYLCCNRDSKHRGDKMNSILALAEVKGFVAAKDKDLEASTIEFFKRQGQVGLAVAVFSINQSIAKEDKRYITEERQHTWPPILWRMVALVQLSTVPQGFYDALGYKVLEDGKMELKGELSCVKVRFTVDQKKNCVTTGEDYTDHVPNDVQLRCLDMDLTQCDAAFRFKASISEWITGDVYISAIERSCNSLQGGLAPHVHVLACEIEDGDTFHAYLVFPSKLHEISMSISEGFTQVERRGDVCLIVQGNSLDAPVTKVGVFARKFLFGMPPLAVEKVDKLIIM